MADATPDVLQLASQAVALNWVDVDVAQLQHADVKSLPHAVRLLAVAVKWLLAADATVHVALRSAVDC